jgi:hypothetical protein
VVRRRRAQRAFEQFAPNGRHACFHHCVSLRLFESHATPENDRFFWRNA